MKHQQTINFNDTQTLWAKKSRISDLLKLVISGKTLSDSIDEVGEGE